MTNNPAGTPYMSGCARGFMMRKIQEAPDRLSSPLIRTGERGEGKFREVSWDEGIAYATNYISDIVASFGVKVSLLRSSPD